MIDQTHIGLLTIAEAAEVAEVAPGTIRSWISRHGLPKVTGLGGQVLVSEKAVLDCERDRRNAGRGRPRQVA